MSLLLLFNPGEHAPDDQTPERSGNKKLQEAAEEGRRTDKSRKAPGPVVDKYFGTKLPPVCAKLGCYLSDDGTRFYCVNAACQKHKKRETKHTRRGRPAPGHFVYFRCPKCESKRVDMNVFANSYTCKTCKYGWQR